jgi:hypothetical protein
LHIDKSIADSFQKEVLNNSSTKIIKKDLNDREVDRMLIDVHKYDKEELKILHVDFNSEDIKNNFIETQNDLRELNNLKLQYEKFTVNLNKEQLQKVYDHSSDSESNDDINSKYYPDSENDKIKAVCMQMEDLEVLKDEIEERNIENFNIELKIELKPRNEELALLQTDNLKYANNESESMYTKQYKPGMVHTLRLFLKKH